MFGWLIRKIVAKELFHHMGLLELRLQNIGRNQDSLNRRMNLMEESLKSLPGNIYDAELVDPNVSASAFPPGVAEIIFERKIKGQ